MARKDSGIVSIVTNIIAAYLKRVTDLLHLAALEAQLALKTLVALAILIFILSSVLTVSWLSLLALLFCYLLSLQYSLLGAAFIIVVINFAALGLIFFIIFKIKNNLFFPATCGQLNYKSHKATNERITTEN